MALNRKSLCLFAALVLLCSCRNSPLCLKEVDNAIEMRPAYERQHRLRVDSLERELSLCRTDSANFAICYEIFELFKCNDIDSAAYYAERMTDLADNVISRTAIASVYSARRNYMRAFELLDRTGDEKLTNRERLILYDTYQSICSAVNNEPGLSDSLKNKSLEKKILYQRKSLSLDELNPFEELYYRGRLLASEGQWQEAVTLLESALEENPAPQKALHCTYAIANCRKSMGRMDEYLEKLCETAVLDFTCCNRQYSSLYNIALFLYGEGDFKRAGDYIQTTIIDAIQCNYSTRIINAVDAQRIITAARLQREKNLKIVLYAGIVLLISFCFVVFLQYLRIKKKNRQIRSINNKVRELNHELHDLNKTLQLEGTIKDQCLFRYMILTVKFIDNIEDYRRLLRKTLKEDGIDSLKEKLSQQDYLYMQYDTFYKLFDEIFISIFPDFLDKINALLQDDPKFELKKDGSFSTELRILAVMRLGIIKSSRISEFLNCPVGSVYTNKANLKTRLCRTDSSLEEVLLSL